MRGPDTTADAWYEQLAGHLTVDAQAAYYGTDPAEVAASVVYDAIVAVDSLSPYLATATALTDAGGYTLLLTRTAADTPWLVERITPPDVG